jgi:arylsulfatase A-like enzyme
MISPVTCRWVLLWLLPCSLLAAEPAARPNIIFILADDLGVGDVGAFFQNARRAGGNKAAHLTPELDKMAASGAQLTNHYCAAPVCAPSRASLIGGVHQGHANVRDNQFDKAIENNHTLATVLHQVGYATAAIGKWGLQGRADKGPPNWPAHPLNRGFDFYFGYMRHADGHEHYPKEAPYKKIQRARQAAKKAAATEEVDDTAANISGVEVWDNRTEISAQLDKSYTADLFTARAKKWIVEQKQTKPGQPFFMYLAFDTPHAILQLPTQAYPAGGGLKGGLQWLGTPGHMINTASGEIDSWMHPDYANATYDGATPNQPWPEVYKRYATSVRRIDDAVGDLMQLLRDLKIDENTLVVFSSDNGPSIESYLPEKITPEFFSSYGPYDGIKRDLWEGGTRTPTIARWPARIPAGRVVPDPSAHWDWLPTFAEVAGLPAPSRADGVSLVPALTGKGALRAREYLYFEYQQAGKTPNFPGFEAGHRDRQRRQMQALRVGDYVGVRYDVKAADDDFEIYQVTADPKETKNLAGDPVQAGLQKRLKELALQARRPDAGAPRPYDSALVPAVEVAGGGLQSGLSWQRFDGAAPWVPATQAMKPAASGLAAGLELAAVGAKPAKEFAAVFSGYLEVPADGEYTFSLTADTGAELRLHEATVIDADFGYIGGSARQGTIKLKAGLHPFRLTTRHASTAKPAVAITWSGPELATQAIPATVFRRAP